MDDDALARVYSALAHADGNRSDRLATICQMSLEVLDVTGAAVMLMAERVHQGTIYSTDDDISMLEELQNVAGEGPCIDAYTLGRPVLEADLAASGVVTWPVLAPQAVRRGIRALYSFPLALDDTCVGALNLYCHTPRHLRESEVADARLLAAMATREVLGLQADASPGALPTAISDLSGDRVSIEQATGMAAVQLGVSIVDAARHIRQVASLQNRHLVEVAREIVARQLAVDTLPDS